MDHPLLFHNQVNSYVASQTQNAMMYLLAMDYCVVHNECGRSSQRSGNVYRM